MSSDQRQCICSHPTQHSEARQLLLKVMHDQGPLPLETSITFKHTTLVVLVKYCEILPILGHLHLDYRTKRLLSALWPIQ